MRLVTVALAGIIAVAGYGSPALAQHACWPRSAAPTRPSSGRSDPWSGRAPSDRELVRYRTLMIRNGWTEADVRQDLAARTDYRKYRNDTGTRPTAAVRSAYQDILGRDPDPEGLRNYRQKMVREGWSEQDVRDDLRRSAEYATLTGRTASADRIIRRAYMDVLHREPDPEGLAEYRKQIIENGWEYHDLRQVLARSEERRDNRGRAVARHRGRGDGAPRLPVRPEPRAGRGRAAGLHGQDHARRLDRGAGRPRRCATATSTARSTSSRPISLITGTGRGPPGDRGGPGAAGPRPRAARISALRAACWACTTSMLVVAPAL